MILISHRGNLNGPIPERENNPKYIDEAILAGFDVEIDLRLVEHELYLGHDEPQYKTDINWVFRRKDFLWIHAKNIELIKMRKFRFEDVSNFKIFFHEKERHVFIKNTQNIWTHDLTNIQSNSIIPLLSKDELLDFKYEKKPFGICSDYISLYKKD